MLILEFKLYKLEKSVKPFAFRSANSVRKEFKMYISEKNDIVSGEKATSYEKTCLNFLTTLAIAKTCFPITRESMRQNGGCLPSRSGLTAAEPNLKGSTAEKNLQLHLFTTRVDSFEMVFAHNFEKNYIWKNGSRQFEGIVPTSVYEWWLRP